MSKGINMYRKILAALLISTFFATNVFAENWTCNLYALGSNRQKLVLKGVRKDTVVDGKVAQTNVTFTDPDGKVQTTEDLWYDGNGVLSKYEMKEFQDNEHGSIEVKDGRAYFSYTKEGKIRTDDEDFKPNAVIGPTTIGYVLKNWKTIMAGDDVDVRFGVMDRLETVGFKFFKIKEEKDGDQDVVVVKMKPTSIFIASLVDPLIFRFDKAGTKVLSIIGRTLPKQLIDGKWKDLDAESVYEYTN